MEKFREKFGSNAQPSRLQLFNLLCVFSLLAIFYQGYLLLDSRSFVSSQPPHAAAALARCEALHLPAGPPDNFHGRTESDRFAAGTKPTLIKNAKIWTGAENGTEVIHGDILLDKGMIMAVGSLGNTLKKYKDDDLEVVDAHNSWVTPGIVDIHSHLGDAPSPELRGAEDGK